MVSVNSSSKSAFEINLLKSLTKSSANKNVAISPFSIFHALAMTVNGSSGDVQTEILKALGNDSLENLNNSVLTQQASNAFSGKDPNLFTVANAIFPKDSPNENFLNVVKSVYGATSEKLQSEEQVNSWVSKNTNGKITRIIEKVTPDIIIILLNAIYFKGVWSRQFNKEKTFKSVFFDKSNKETTVDMMREKFTTGYFESEKIQMINLPYQGDNFNAYVILPAGNIDDFINSLTPDEFDDYFKSLTKKEVNLSLPKFKVEAGLELKQALSEDLGIPSAFAPSNCFVNMCNSDGLFISSVMHKVYIEVDEEGTTAAAVTSVVMSRCMKIVPNMEVNRPFLFVLREKSIDRSLFIIKVEQL